MPYALHFAGNLFVINKIMFMVHYSIVSKLCLLDHNNIERCMMMNDVVVLFFLVE